MEIDEYQTNGSNQPRKPILSLILCARNDHYMGNSVWRLQTALNYVAQSVQKAKRVGEVEILVTDWGSEIPLHTVLRLNPAAAGLVSFLVVPPVLAKEIQGDSPFAEVVALNAAVRRSKGMYIGRIDQDTLVGSHFLKIFFELYEGKRQLEVPIESALMLSDRRHIPFRFASRCPSFWEVDQFIHWFGRFIREESKDLPPKLFIRSYVGIWLLHKNVWLGCGGYDENMKYYNWMEVDMILRLQQRGHNLVNLGKTVNYNFYHLGHNPPLPDLAAYADRKVNPGINLENPPALNFHPNNQNWGLEQYSLKIEQVPLPALEKEGELFSLPQFRQVGLILLLISIGPILVWDKLSIPVIIFLSPWKYRGIIAWKYVQGQPLNQWPALLLDLWRQKKSLIKM